MNYQEEIDLEMKKLLARRHFFRDCGVGLGSMALASLLKGSGLAGEQAPAKQKIAASNPLAPKAPHFPAKAKRVIFMFMAGAPSQLELFDYKPELVKYNGKSIPQEMVKGVNYAFIKPDAALYATELRFARHGQSGAEISEALPYLAKVVDDITIVKSMTTDAINHAPGQIFMNTGSVQFGRPSMGSWVTYGLGCETQDLPAFVVLSSGGGISGGASNWGAGFLPTFYQGVTFRRTGDPILSLASPRGINRQMQRQSLDTLNELLTSLCMRLEQRMVRQQVYCKEIDVFARFENGSGWKDRIKSDKPIQSGTEVLKLVRQRMHKFEQQHHCEPIINHYLTGIGITVSDFVPEDMINLNLFEDAIKDRNLRKVVYDIKNRFGKDKVMKAAEVGDERVLKDVIGFGSIKDFYVDGEFDADYGI